MTSRRRLLTTWIAATAGAEMVGYACAASVFGVAGGLVLGGLIEGSLLGHWVATAPSTAPDALQLLGLGAAGGLLMGLAVGLVTGWRLARLAPAKPRAPRPVRDRRGGPAPTDKSFLPAIRRRRLRP